MSARQRAYEVVAKLINDELQSRVGYRDGERHLLEEVFELKKIRDAMLNAASPKEEKAQ